MGRRAGLIIGGILFLTIMGTFLVMYLEGSLLMERISLGAGYWILRMLQKRRPLPGLSAVSVAE